MNDPATATSSTPGPSVRTPSPRMAEKRCAEQALGTPNKKTHGSTKEAVIASTSHGRYHDHNHDDVHEDHDGHEEHDNNNNNTANFLPRSPFDRGENVDQYLGLCLRGRTSRHLQKSSGQPLRDPLYDSFPTVYSQSPGHFHASRR